MLQLVLAASLLLLALPGLSPAQDIAGPPAPTPVLTRQQLAAREADVRAAERAWRWYAAAWALDAGTTAISLCQGNREINPLFPDRPELVLTAKAAVGVYLWRLEVHLARRGRPGLGKIGRWIFLGVSVVAGGHNLVVAW